MHKFYPNGFDKEKIDIRLKEKLIQLEENFNKYNNSNISHDRTCKYEWSRSGN